MFSYVPVEDSAGYKSAFGEFIQHLSKTTGKKVRWHDTTSGADQIKTMRVGDIYIAGISPGSTVYAVNLAGYVPIAVMCKSDGSYGVVYNVKDL